MYPDPVIVTINAVATPMARTKISDSGAVYTSADGNTTVTTKQTATKDRFRREFRLSQQKIAADPISALNASKGISVYLVVDEPKYGFSDTEIKYLIDGLKAYIAGVNQDRLLGGES